MSQTTTYVFATALSALSALAACAPYHAASPGALQDASPHPSATPRLFTFTSDAAGFSTHTYFYDTGAEVVAIDTQFTPAHAQAALTYLRTQTPNPVTYAIVTHPNPDKFNGMTVFQAAGAKVVMSEATAAALPAVHAYKKAFFVDTTHMFTAETYPVLGTPDLTFATSQYTLRLGDGTALTLQTLATPAVSSTQTVVHAPAVHALIVGDMVHYQTHAWLEGGIVAGKATPTLDAWQGNLRALATTYAHDPALRVYGGRGPNAPLAEAMTAQQAYLSEVTAALQRGRRTTAQPPCQTLTAATLAQAMQQRYPGFAQPALVEYSAYALLASEPHCQ